MKTRKTKKFRKIRNKTKRGGGPKKSKSKSKPPTVDVNKELETIVDEINKLNDGFNNINDYGMHSEVKNLIVRLENLHSENVKFNEDQKSLINSILTNNNKNTERCLIINKKRTDCNFLKDYINRIELVIGNTQETSTEIAEVLTSDKSETALTSDKSETALIADEPFKEPFKEPETILTAEEEARVKKLNDRAEQALNYKSQTKEEFDARVANTFIAQQKYKELEAQIFITNYLTFDTNKHQITQLTQEQSSIAKQKNDKDLQDLDAIRSQFSLEDKCEFMTSLFPSFDIQPTNTKLIGEEEQYRKTVCALLFLIGKISYILRTNYIFNLCDYYILIKGGTALKLMANNVDFKYASEDIDVSIMTRPGIPYDAHKIDKFLNGFASYCKWFLNIPQLTLQPQKRGLSVLKILYITTARNEVELCDIDYQDHEKQDTFQFYKNIQTRVIMRNKMLFDFQNENVFYYEKLFLKEKYKTECKMHKCDIEENKKKKNVNYVCVFKKNLKNQLAQ